jgi:hypothetical protein
MTRDEESRDDRPVMGGRESRALARELASSDPAFAAYLASVTHDRHYEDGTIARIVDWHYVPEGYAPSRDAYACLGQGGGHCGPHSRGTFYTKVDWVFPTRGQQLGMGL